MKVAEFQLGVESEEMEAVEFQLGVAMVMMMAEFQPEGMQKISQIEQLDCPQVCFSFSSFALLPSLSLRNFGFLHH